MILDIEDSILDTVRYCERVWDLDFRSTLDTILSRPLMTRPSLWTSLLLGDNRLESLRLLCLGAHHNLPLQLHYEGGDKNVTVNENVEYVKHVPGCQNGHQPQNIPGLLLEGLVQEGCLHQEKNQNLLNHRSHRSVCHESWLMIDKINKYTHSIRHHHHQSSWRKFRNVTIITFTLLAIVSSGALVFNQARHRILVF